MKNKITNGLSEFTSFLEGASHYVLEASRSFKYGIEEYSTKRESNRSIELEITKFSAIIKRNNEKKRNINSYNDILAKKESIQKDIDDMSEDERKLFNEIFHDTLHNKNDDIFEIQKEIISLKNELISESEIKKINDYICYLEKQLTKK